VKANKKFKFGEWLPDQEALDSPGIIECLNVLHESGNYVPYLPLVVSGVALAQTPLYALRANSNGGSVVYVGGPSKLYTGTGAGSVAWTDRTPGGIAGSNNWSMAQYTETVIATDFADHPQYHTLGAGGNFARLTGAFGDAPDAGIVGVIGQSVFLGNLSGIAPYAVQWSGINAPLNWPAPASADAIAQQSGRQYLAPSLGTVYGVSEGDQWGIILLSGGLARVTYTGGDTAYGFDTIQKAPGVIGPNAWIKVGQLIYYASPVGFFVTDGTSVVPIGRGKVDGYFSTQWDRLQLDVRVGVHWSKRLIYWTFVKNGGTPGVPTEMMIYNIDEKNWTHVQDGVLLFVHGEEALFTSDGIEAFDAATNKCGLFTGLPGTATITTAEAELNPGGTALVNGFTPQIDGDSNFMTVTVTLGSRESQGQAALTNTAATALTPFTGAADFSVDARFHRAQINIAGPFNKAIGGVFDAQATGGL
jgi:hypothetical protein